MSPTVPVKNCPFCRAVIADALNKCPYCRLDLPMPRTCGFCRQRVSESAKVCPFCAEDISASTDEAQASKVEVGEQQPLLAVEVQAPQPLITPKRVVAAVLGF